VRMTVSNGRPPRSTGPAGGLGISGMSRRVAQLGGTFTAGPKGAEWLVVVTLPGGRR